MKKTVLFIALLLIITSCGSIKSSLKNVDNSAPVPVVKNNAFVINAYSKDKKYGYNKDYPINIFYKGTKNDTINQKYFLNALAGPKGEKITFTKLENCCPFPTKTSEMGAGFLDVYELKWAGLKTPIILYLNIYERGQLMVPVGLSLKKL
nr:2-dehydro-3-deoxyphosphooctonate aldolase [uncultured Flavobacterium sp.]